MYATKWLSWQEPLGMSRCLLSTIKWLASFTSIDSLSTKFLNFLLTDIDKFHVNLSTPSTIGTVAFFEDTQCLLKLPPHPLDKALRTTSV